MNDLRLDWFEATLECDILTVLAITMLSASQSETAKPEMVVGRGRLGYKRSHTIKSETTEITILDLGSDGWPHIIGTGQNADIARRIALASTPTGRVSRVDIACDALEPWWKAQGRATTWAIDHPRTPITYVGDFLRATNGRTIYVGAPSSERRVRIYEKGIQLGENPDWIRVELQYRPNNRNAKAWAYQAGLDALANSSKAFLAMRAIAGLYAPPAHERPGRQPLLALARQYGNVLRDEVPEAWRIIVDHLKYDWKP